ncbi:MAG: ATP-dependent protease, partial [Mycobacterium sp.]
PRAEVRSWPDEPDAAVAAESIGELQERVLSLFDRLATARGGELPPQDLLFAGVAMAETPGEKLYALASTEPKGQADRYSVLAAPSAHARLQALSEAVETMAAMIDFQLRGE